MGLEGEKAKRLGKSILGKSGTSQIFLKITAGRCRFVSTIKCRLFRKKYFIICKQTFLEAFVKCMPLTNIGLPDRLAF